MDSSIASPSDRVISLTLLAPLSGIIVPLERVPDPAFARRLAGDGLALDPLDQRLVAPCDARVLHVHRAGHALTLSASGLEVLIHVGLDTVALNGEGFEPRVKAGDEVRTGDLLLSFDADYVARHARSLITPVLVVSMDRVAALQGRTGRVLGGRDALIEVRLAATDAAATAGAQGTAVESAPVVIASETGLHARPAAVVVATARRFSSDVRLVKEGREANARSVVSIMMLEVGHGDAVTVVARGEDAHAAADAVVKALASAVAADHAGHARSLAGTPAASAAAVRSTGAAGGVFTGVPASPGVAIGRVFQFRYADEAPEERAADPSHERRALDAAIAGAHRQLEALQLRLAGEGTADRVAIFGAHQELLEDPELLDGAAEQIRQGASAAFAWRQAYRQQADRLLALRNELLAGRAADLRDVGRRVLHLLVGRDCTPPRGAPRVDRRGRGPRAVRCRDAGSHPRARLLHDDGQRHVARRYSGAGSGRPRRRRHGSARARASVRRPGRPRWRRRHPSARSFAGRGSGDRRAARHPPPDCAPRTSRWPPSRPSPGTAIAWRSPPTSASVDEARRVSGMGGEGDRAAALRVPLPGAPHGAHRRRAGRRLRGDHPRRSAPSAWSSSGPSTSEATSRCPISPVATEANPFLGERGIRLLLNRPEVFARPGARHPAGVAAPARWPSCFR